MVKTVTKKKFWILDFGFCCPSEFLRILWALNNHMRLFKVIYLASKGFKSNNELARLQ